MLPLTLFKKSAFFIITELPQIVVSEETVAPRKPDEVIEVVDFEAPRFTTTLQKHVDVLEGTTITMTCVVTGKPRPEITVYMVRIVQCFR